MVRVHGRAAALGSTAETGDKALALAAAFAVARLARMATGAPLHRRLGTRVPDKGAVATAVATVEIELGCAAGEM